MLELARTGGEAPPGSNDDTATNAIVYAETKDRSVADIKRDAESSWSALRSALEASSESELTRPHPQLPEAQVWEAVPGMGGHLGVHLMSWFMDSGDAAGAEAAAKWAYGFECGLLPEGPKRSDAAYNLACFYARAGRVDEALPLLRDSFRFQPSLVAWARQDPDLAGMRDSAAMRELLEIR
jgi:hypothetical protein